MIGKKVSVGDDGGGLNAADFTFESANHGSRESVPHSPDHAANSLTAQIRLQI